MFRRLTSAAAIGCALALAGCNSTSADNKARIDAGVAIGVALAPAAAQVVPVSKVQGTAVKVCGFEPAAGTVINILGTLAGISAVTDVATYAAGRICDAVRSNAEVYAQLSPERPGRAASRRQTKPADEPKGEVNGVPVRGRFVAPPTPKSR